MADNKKGKPPTSTSPANPKDQTALEQARQKIRERIAIVEEAKKLDLQRKRIDIVGKGVGAYTEKDLANAAASFKGYIKILEDLKGAPSGGLSPSHFDKKDDLPELILISGVFWDLVKLYDRTRSPERYAEFKGYLSKYIQFTKGMNYQTMASETMRKYIQAKRPVHMKDFKDAHKVIQVSRCFVATELVEHVHVDTIPALRDYRDEVLVKSRAGRAFVAWYYRKGPGIAERVGAAPAWVRVGFGKMLDLLANLVDPRK
jgi:hypothetical protein